MKNAASLFFLLCFGALLPGCATRPARGGTPVQVKQIEPSPLRRVLDLSGETKKQILALAPEQVTDQEVRELLSPIPAPQIINIHGGLFPIKRAMTSFARFLIGMGYPEASIRIPGSDEYTYGYHDDCEEIAGTVAWHYEREGLRPIIVGHSLGGIQAVRVLHKLAGDATTKLAVWNPETRSVEQRCEIVDPLTGLKCPVVGLQISYATAAVAGGMARLLPNQWDMSSTLRQIPDSVVEFTGFQKGLDLLGGDYLGYGAANDYHATGQALVRNVRLPSSNAHLSIPYAKELLENPEALDWIQHYQPGREPGDTPEATMEFGLKNARILWAAEVWYGIKKHWVLELQRLIQSQSTRQNDR